MHRYTPLRYIDSIYRSFTTVERTTVLELAILGSLKEQPLHGYELKKRVGETQGSVWAISFGSLYPALRRLERDGAIEVVDPAHLGGGSAFGHAGAAIPPTGSLSGDLAAARLRRSGKPTRRNRKAYGITPAGEARLRALLLDPDAVDDDRTFALKLAFCVHLDPAGRRQLLERRRAALVDEVARARQAPTRHGDRYRRALAEHRTQSVERDLEWVESLIAAEPGSVPEPQTGSEPERETGSEPEPRRGEHQSETQGAAAS
jgi:DNA-binding PadR family transcriptional regulator